MRVIGLGLGVVWIACQAAFAVGGEAGPVDAVPVGVARADITPDHPVRLVGYANRTTESQGVAGRLWAKALAIGRDGGDGPAVLITVDNCGVPDNVTGELSDRLVAKAELKRERIVVCSSHTHTGPWLEGYLPWHYVEPLPPAHKENMRRYTRALTDALEKIAVEALAARRPGRLSWTQGQVSFAANRRVLKNGKWAGFGVNPAGPVDHSLPLLCVSDEQGKCIAVVANYACHCTTLTGSDNQIHGDWAGFAQASIEADHPGVTAMITIGCGGDANPEPRGAVEMAQQHGRTVAAEVTRLLSAPRKPISPALQAQRRQLQLPFGRLPTREELVERSKIKGREGDLAQSLLAILDRDGAIPKSLDYSVSTWAFGQDLGMVFLAGEVVVDYSLRLKRELDGSRLWVTAYANDVPCYIASKRLIPEGGYEVDSSMISYGQPTRLAPEAEDVIITAAREMLGTFAARASK